MATRLREVRTIAVIGLSEKPMRDSYGVGEYLDERGYTVVPVNPTIRMWRNHQSFPDLKTAKAASESVGKPVDMVVVFRRAHEVSRILREVHALKIPAVWCQLGVIDWDAAQWAKEHGMWVAMDHCVAVEHRKLVGTRVGA